VVSDAGEDETFLRLKNWLESEDSGDWVLIVDNADNPSEFRTLRYIPQRFKGKLIVTTRSRTAASRHLLCELVEVPRMDVNEAEVLFRRLYMGIVASTDTSYIGDMLLDLDYLPLAIVGAAAYMQTTGTLPTEYLKMFNSTRTYQARLLMEKFNDIRRELQQDGSAGAEEEESMTESVLTTYYITFQQIQKLCPLSADLMRIFAFLDRQMIPERFLVESGLDGVTDMLSFREAIGYLLGFSLITQVSGPKSTDPTSYDVHRLVHLSMETYVSSQEPGEAMIWKKKASEIVSRLFPTFRYEDRSICSAYLTHALAVIPYSDNPELRENVASYLYFKGEYGAAEGHLVRCLEIRERAGSDTLSVAGRLGGVYSAQGDYSRALEWYGRVLTGEEKSLGGDHPSTLTIVNNMALVYDKQGDYSKALEWYDRALTGTEKSLGKDHPDTLTIVNNMASVYDDQGDYSKALEWYGRTLTGEEKSLGKDHPDTLTTVNNMASVYSHQGDYRRALELYGRALAGREQSLGKDHPGTLTTVNNMALMYDHQGDYSRALEWYGRALAGREQSLGKDHPDTLTTVNNMALVYDHQGDYSKALEWYGRALVGKEQSLGKDHPDTLTTVSNMASVYDDQGDCSKALEWYDRALVGRERSLGKDHPDTLTTVNNMASVFNHQGDYSKSLEWYGRALVGSEQSLGKDHPDTLTTVGNMASVYDDQGDYSKALEWYGRALVGMERSLGKDHPNTLTTVNNMASVYNHQGDYSKSLEWYGRVLVGREQSRHTHYRRQHGIGV
jgi:tetratricopeptide (TPR) repeat protein